MSEKPYSLCSEPGLDGYWAKDGQVVVPDQYHGGHIVVQRAVWIEDTMSRECRYDKRYEDPRCPVDCARRLNREGVADAEIINE